MPQVNAKAQAILGGNRSGPGAGAIGHQRPLRGGLVHGDGWLKGAPGADLEPPLRAGVGQGLDLSGQERGQGVNLAQIERRAGVSWRGGLRELGFGVGQAAGQG